MKQGMVGDEMSWQDILKDMDAEEEFERDALRRDIEVDEYEPESPDLKRLKKSLGG